MSSFGKSARRAGLTFVVGALAYLGLAYGVAPDYWRHYEHQTGLALKPMTTSTSLGIPGDALNVGLEGTREDILCAMRESGWHAADPITLGSSVKIAGSVIVHRAYPTAPVSDLYWEGRKQDLAFEKPSGATPSTRHHVRFWRALAAGDQGAPVWLGSATFDRSVGVCHYTGAVTHHIAADIDAERDLLAKDLAATGHVSATYQVSGVGPTLRGRNGGGDPYFTDGEITVSRLRPDCASQDGAPNQLPSPPEARARTTVFGWLARLRRALF